MENIDKIQVSLVKYDKTYGNTYYEFNVKGNNIDYIVVNTLRRTIMSFVPIFAFTEFTFEKNTSVFNNNYIKLRLQNLPIYSINNENIYYNKENKKENKESYDSDDEFTNNPDVTEQSVLTDQMTMYINFTNETKENKPVTTNHAKFYYNEKEIKSPYKTPIPIIDLQPSQQIALSVKSSLGIEDHNAIFSPVTICAYKQINDHEFNFFLESRGQLTEQRIISVAIDNIIKRMNDINLLLKDNNNENIEGIININNEDHTLGNLLSRGLQLHDDISFAGYKMHHPLSKQVEIHYKMKTKKSIYDTMNSVIEYYTKIYTFIKKQI